MALMSMHGMFIVFLDSRNWRDLGWCRSSKVTCTLLSYRWPLMTTTLTP